MYDFVSTFLEGYYRMDVYVDDGYGNAGLQNPTYFSWLKF